MAHADKLLNKQRTVRLESLRTRHANQGDLIPLDAQFRYDGMDWVVVRDALDHGRCHLRLVGSTYQGALYLHTSEPHGVLYRPIDSSMTASDIEGATYAYDDGTHWHFAHCSPHEQIDFAAEVEAFAKAQFDEVIHESNAKASGATANIARNSAFAKSTALIQFAAEHRQGCP